MIELDGATLGGGGRLHVIGTLDAHESTTGYPAVLTTRPEDSSYAGPRGILEIGDEGLLDVHGLSSLRLSTQYIVDVHGKARLRDDAGLVADHGTRSCCSSTTSVRVSASWSSSTTATSPWGGPRASRYPHVREPRPHRQARAGLTTIQGRYYGADGKVSGDAGGNGAS